MKTVKLAERRVFSQSFKPLYDEGMGLVEKTAEYLDGKGRAEAKKLSRLAATLYAAESMRLTTRLMQIASWLLLQRAANSGEMTRAQVAAENPRCGSIPPRRTKTPPAGANCRWSSSNSSPARCACKRWCGAWTRKSTVPARPPRSKPAAAGSIRSPIRSRCSIRLSPAADGRSIDPSFPVCSLFAGIACRER